jgi:phenylacetate-CoA ligase
MPVYNLIARYIFGPLVDLSRGPKVRKYIKELEESQWWPRDKILELQNERLRRLVKYSYYNVPYYQRIFDERGLKPDDIQSSVDLVKLPVLTKRTIRENVSHMMAQGFPSSEMVLTRTGGSTGEPLVFYTTTDDRFKWAYAKDIRTFRQWGYEVGDKHAQIQLKRSQRSAMVKLRRFIEGTKTFVSSETSENLPLFIKKLETFQPKFISGYPSMIYLLARVVESQGKIRFRPKAITTHSEQLYDFQRELLRKVFGCETYSRYESYEMNEIAAECSEHSGYHIAAESIILEIVNNEGEHVPVGEEGRILNTNLHNYAMPFIRYDTGDEGVISDKVCPCGRGLPLLAKLSGRTTDFLLTTSRKKIPGLAIDIKVLASEGVDQFQIIQEDYKEVIVKVVVTKGYQQEDMGILIKKITNEYKGILGEDMEIRVEFADQIPTTREGKRRVVVSKLPGINEEKHHLSL